MQEPVENPNKLPGFMPSPDEAALADIMKEYAGGATREATIKVATETEEVIEYKCKRSLPTVLRFLQNTVLPEYGEHAKVSILVYTVPADPKKPEERNEGVVAEGELSEVIESIKQRIVPPMAIMQQLIPTLDILFDVSDMKGIIISLVAEEDGKLDGVSRLSPTSEVSDDNVALLGAGAANHIQAFKDGVKQRRPNVKFPDDDDSGIIIPGR